MNDHIQTAIIGYGKSAKNFHVPLLKAADGFEVRSVLQRTKNDAKEDFPDAKIIRDTKDLLKDDAIDLIFITTPNHLHFDQAFDALSADKHVVVEKPFTITSKEAEKLIRLADSKNKVLTVFQSRRWDGDFYTLKKIIKEGRIGRLLEFESNYHRYRKLKKDGVWKETAIPGSGILYDLSPHLIDQSLQLFGMPDSLYADIRHQRGGEADDWFVIDLYYDDFKVTLRAGMLVTNPTPRFVLRGENGSFVKYGMDIQEEDLASGKSPLDPNWGVDPESNVGTLYLAEKGSFREEKVETLRGDYPAFYKQLRRAILENEEAPVSPDSAKNVIRIIEKSIESSRDRRALPIID
ncbi:MAG: oxidoreductase [Balneolaceae bacterium]